MMRRWILAWWFFYPWYGALDVPFDAAIGPFPTQAACETFRHGMGEPKWPTLPCWSDGKP